MRQWMGTLVVLAACLPRVSGGHGREREEDEGHEGREEHGEHRGRGEAEPRSASPTAPEPTPAPTAATAAPTTTRTAETTPSASADYARECGSCHIAYPPRALPARSWEALMGGLGSHFGDDATLAEPARASVTAWLTAHAGTDRGETPTRITEAAWFLRQHDELRRGTVGPDAAVKSWSACGSCHPSAASGSFEEDEVRIPGGRRWEE